MKKTFISVFAFLIIISNLSAQMEKVTSAYNYLRNKQFDKAKDRIDIATENTSSNTKAKTWYYRAEIYKSIAASENKNVAGLDVNAHEKSRKAYLKTQELDLKNRYSDESKNGLVYIQQHLLQTGYQSYKSAHLKRKENVTDPEATKEYNDAIKDFTLYLSWVPGDTNALWFRGSCARLVNDNEQALKDFKDLDRLGTRNPLVYQVLFNMFKESNNWDDAIIYMEKASEKWPNNEFIMNNKIVSYDRAGRLDEAVSKLEAKIKEDPKSEKAQYLLGYTCSQLYNNKDITNDKRELYANKAISAYKQVIEINSVHKRAYHDLAILYYNLGGEKLKASGDAWKDAEKSQELDKWGKDYLNLSIKYNELHRQKVNSKDKKAIQTLMKSYSRLQNTEKYKQMKELLNTLN